MRIPPSARAVVLALGLAALFGAARAETFVQLNDLSGETIARAAFRVTRPVDVHVRCTGAGGDDAEDLYAYGWILALRDRQVVWSLAASSGKRGRKGERVFDGPVTLPAGEYCAYFADFEAWKGRVKIFKFFGKEIGRVEVDRNRYKHAPQKRSSWGLELSTRGAGDASAAERIDAPSSDRRAVVRLTGLGDGAFEQRGFRLPDRMPITVYCVGEYSESHGVMVDGGWILDATTRQPVWEMGPANFRHAGGAAKNKVSRETITLPRGDYVATYVCDDSHGPEGWNDPPPHDPDAWGITIWAASDADAARIAAFDPNTGPEPIVALVRQGDDADASAGIAVSRAAAVRVYALGERGGGEFADHGWIENLSTKTILWEMTDGNTRHAGGADKNRVADVVVRLPAGRYAVHYQTDDSHSFPSWNAAAPHDPTAWGITLYPVGDDRGAFSRFALETLDVEPKNALVHRIRVGSGADLESPFHLPRAGRVRIVALGEGLDREMYDYGWIERADGQVVWEMTMRNTKPAGGAAKNRVFEGEILLDAGDYVARYVTDDSHAWGNWNDKKPPGPERWGLTIVGVE